MSSNPVIREDAIQQQILLAAQQLFQKYGLQRVTVDDVAKAIGKGRSSLYYYYKSKEEIFAAVVDMEITGILEEISRAVDRVTGTEAKIVAFCVTKLHLIRKRRELYGALEDGMNADEMSRYAPLKKEAHARIITQEGALLKKILKGGIALGELRAIPAQELESLVFVLLGTVHGLKREIVIEEAYGRIEPAARTLARLVIHGLKA